jgi:DNA-directed RNA polymerase specialized sigma24 family protein
MRDAESVRQDILSSLMQMFVDDGTEGHKDELDFYECKFNRAFRFFRIDIVRREIARLAKAAQMPESDDEGEQGPYDEVFARVSEAFRSPATQEGDVLRGELYDAILALPPDERDAVILVHVMGYQEESDDPDKETAATRCDCKGRTIRNRLTRAAAKLARFKEAL